MVEYDPRVDGVALVSLRARQAPGRCDKLLGQEFLEPPDGLQALQQRIAKAFPVLGLLQAGDGQGFGEYSVLDGIEARDRLPPCRPRPGGSSRVAAVRCYLSLRCHDQSPLRWRGM